MKLLRYKKDPVEIIMMKHRLSHVIEQVARNYLKAGNNHFN